MRGALVRTTTSNNDIVCFKLLHQLLPTFHLFRFQQLLLLQSMPLVVTQWRHFCNFSCHFLFQILAKAGVERYTVWVMTPCSLVGGYRW
jgi:hypothetical protein